MKKKLNQMLVVIAVLAIVFTTFLITVVYHQLFETQVIEDLKTVAQLLKKCEADGTLEELAADKPQFLDGVRVTLMDNRGEVIYDSEADASVMTNHSLRPEVTQALEKGEGQAVRRSETLAKNSYYYALCLDSGYVLRTGKEASSILSIFASAVPSLAIVALLLVFACMGIAHFMTAKLLAPIEQLTENLDSDSQAVAYLEMQPLIDTIKKQHADIIKNAKMRQEFTANVSHELKTPLTSISGYAELIETGMASEEDVSRFAHGIRTSANRLLILINDIIRLSELDGTEEQPVMEHLNLFPLATTCVDMLAMNAEKHRVTISLEGEDAYVYGNRQMLEELLYNLCDNAIRYNNENGTVLVEVKAMPQGVLLRVKDTGIGIPREHQERIFERFYRVDKSRSKSTGGTGLGLAIVKHIIARHEAEMELYSEPGKGTEYRIMFKNHAETV